MLSYAVKFFLKSLAIFIVVLAVLLSTGRAVMPLLAKERQKLENLVSDALEAPVQIGKVCASWHGFSPVFIFQRVLILNPNTHHPIAKFERIKLSIAVLESLRQRQLVPAKVIISGANMAIWHDKGKGFSIIKDKQSTINPEVDINTTLLWLLNNKRIVLKNINIFWHGPNNLLVPLSNLSLRLIQRGNSHWLLAETTLKQTVPTRLQIKVQLQGDLTKKKSLRVHFYVSGQHVVLDQWLKHLQYKSWRLTTGQADFQLWGDWQLASGFVVQSAIHINRLNLTAKQQHYFIQKFSTNIYAKLPPKLLTAGQQLSSSCAQHSASACKLAPSVRTWLLAASNIELKFHDKHWHLDAMAVQGQLQADKQISLTAVKAFNLPLTEIIYFDQQFAFIPKTWRKQYQQLRLTGKLSALQWQRQPLCRLQQPWCLQLDFIDLAWQPWHAYPGIAHASGQLTLTPVQGHLAIDSQNLQIVYPKLFTKPQQFSTVQANIAWQQQRPDQWQFKATNIEVANQNLQLKAKVKFNTQAEFKPVDLALIAGYHIKDATALRAYWHLPMLSPVLKQWLDQAIVKAEDLSGKLVLRGPLAQFPFTQANGQFVTNTHFQQLDFRINKAWPLLKNLTADLTFAGEGMFVTVHNGDMLKTKVISTTARIPSICDSDNMQLYTQSQLQTTIQDALVYIHQSPLQAKLEHYFHGLKVTGPAGLKLNLQIPLSEHQHDVKVKGQLDLQKVDLLIPKLNLALQDLHGSSNFTEHNFFAPQLQARLLNHLAQLSVQTDSQQQTSPLTQFRLNSSVTLKALAAHYKVNLPKWLQGSTAISVVGKIKSLVQGISGQVNLHTDLQGIAINLPSPFAKTVADKKPLNINVNFSQQPWIELNANYANEQLKLQLEPTDKVLHLKADSSILRGEINIPNKLTAATPLIVRLDKLKLLTNSKAEHQFDQLKPNMLLPIDLAIDKFHLNNRLIGKLQLQAQPITGAYQVKSLLINNPNYVFDAQGVWRMVGKRQRTTIKGSLAINELKDFLIDWGLGGNLSSHDAHADFNLGWRGSPVDLNLKHLGGTTSFYVANGRITNVGKTANSQLGLGKLLNLFSLQTLSWRLRLDFSDLTKKGFSFSELKGNFFLINGHAHTQDTIMNGPVAYVSMVGGIDLVDERYDLLLRISPYVTSSLPVVAGAASTAVLGPLGLAVGAATWLVNKAITPEIRKVASYEYKVTGPWSKPVVIPQQK